MRIVFDTNTIISALLFSNDQLAWLRRHWRLTKDILLVSKNTVGELIRVLTYPKFQLEADEIECLLAEFIPYTTVINVRVRRSNPKCSDSDDQMFIDLAISGKADVLVTGDKAILSMDLPCNIITPREFKGLVI